MNKKGLLGLTGVTAFILISIVAFILLFIFTSFNKFYLVGMILIIVPLVIGFRGNLTRTKGLFIVLFIVLGIGVLFLTSQGILQTAFTGGRYIEVPITATIQCQQLGTSKVYTNSMPSSGNWISDNFPENTNEWSITLKEDVQYFGGEWFEYYLCPQRAIRDNCIAFDGRGTSTDSETFTISSDWYVWAEYQTYDVYVPPVGVGREAVTGATIIVNYKPFVLIRDDVLRGGRQVIDSEGCSLPTNDISWTKRIVSSSRNDNLYDNNNPMKPGEIYNYITGSIVAVSDGGTQSGGWCIYENNQANIYQIDTVELGDDTRYNIVNFDKKISSAECCNGESYPNGRICENGQFIDIAESECNTRLDCGTLERFAISNTETAEWRCINNQCTESNIQEVECTTDSQCATNERCSRNTFTCIQASSVGGTGEQRQDVVTTEDTCAFYQELKTIEEVDYGPLYWRAIIPGVEPKVTTFEECRTADWVYFTMFGVIVALLVLAIFMSTKPQKRVKKSKKR